MDRKREDEMKKLIARRLERGDDLMLSIKQIAKENHLQAAVVLSGVGCVSEARLRDASGVNIQEVKEHLEIVSITGTVSEQRTHLHVSFAKEDLSVIGGHLVEGCIINTTCELILMELENLKYGVTFDEETGYKEIIFESR